MRLPNEERTIGGQRVHEKMSALVAAHEQREACAQTQTAERRLVCAQPAAQRVALKEAEGENGDEYQRLNLNASMVSLLNYKISLLSIL